MLVKYWCRKLNLIEQYLRIQSAVNGKSFIWIKRYLRCDGWSEFEVNLIKWHQCKLESITKGGCWVKDNPEIINIGTTLNAFLIYNKGRLWKHYLLQVSRSAVIAVNSSGKVVRIWIEALYSIHLTWEFLHLWLVKRKTKVNK